MQDIYRHKKTGGLYFVIDDNVRIESTGERGVLYQSLQNDRIKWVRSYEQFHDGRFEVLNSVEYQQGQVIMKHDASF